MHNVHIVNVELSKINTITIQFQHLYANIYFKIYPRSRVFENLYSLKSI